MAFFAFWALILYSPEKDSSSSGGCLPYVVRVASSPLALFFDYLA
jgi:hypothetical protein